MKNSYHLKKDGYKFLFVADNPYNQITKLRVNCLMQLALFLCFKRFFDFFFKTPPKTAPDGKAEIRHSQSGLCPSCSCRGLA